MPRSNEDISRARPGRRDTGPGPVGQRDGVHPVLADVGRVLAFSDAVFAIIITLLVIEIHRPNAAPGQLAGALLAAWPAYAAFALAFLYVGVIWLNHHGLFRQIRYVDLRLNWINLGILGTAALMPLPTGVLAYAFQSGNVSDQRAAVVFYAVVAAMMSAAWLPIFPYLDRNPTLLASTRPAGSLRREAARPVIGMAICVAAAGLGWTVSPWLAIGLFVVLVAFHAQTSEGRDRKGKEREAPRSRGPNSSPPPLD